MNKVIVVLIVKVLTLISSISILADCDVRHLKIETHEVQTLQSMRSSAQTLANESLKTPADIHEKTVVSAHSV